MRYIKLLIVITLFIIGCEPIVETNIEKFTIKAQIINVNNLTKYDGLHFYLESNYYSQTSGTVIETIAEDIANDTGKIEFTYESTYGTGVTIKCIELPNFSKRLNSNQNISPIFYMGDSSTLIITFNSINPLPAGDTLFFRYNMPYLPQDTSMLIGPLLNGATYKIRSVNAGGYSFTHGRGYNDLILLGDNRYKSIKIKGDPFIDSVVVNY